MMARPGFADLLRRPVVLAPMAGGPSTPGLVIAAAGAGALGFLAAGYKTPEAMTAEISAVRAGTPEPFGVNVFVPGVALRGHRRTGPVPELPAHGRPHRRCELG